MAEAIVTGILNKKIIPSNQIIVSDPNPERRRVFEALNVNVTEKNEEIIKQSDVVLLAVKPQNVNSVLSALSSSQPTLLSNSPILWLSIVAGTTLLGNTFTFNKWQKSI